MGLNVTPMNPIKALYWTTVINGIVAVSVMAMMMLMAAEPKIMGPVVVAGWLKVVGWASTAVMTAAVMAMLVTSF